MNFLAHLWLADKTGTSLAGAILGDVARGSDLSAYPVEIAEGIRLHRKIDAATDRHPQIVRVRERFAPGRRRYAGIVLDLACDYVLARDWTGYSGEALPLFCERVSAEIEQAAPWFAHAGGRAIEAQRFTRLLLSYAEPAGIEHAIQRTAVRLRQPEPLLAAADNWQQSAEELRAVMPELLEDLRLLGSGAAEK
jgi:acyl carrier protein phosphodiesterase